MTEVNVPTLRKAVEWAEAEHAKGELLSHWFQSSWAASPREHAAGLASKRVNRGDTHEFIEIRDDLFAQLEQAECGTAYCIAGYVACEIAGEKFSEAGFNKDGESIAEVAVRVLGIDPPKARLQPESGHLFHGENTIEDVRRIAEELAGERL